MSRDKDRELRICTALCDFAKELCGPGREAEAAAALSIAAGRVGAQALLPAGEVQSMVGTGYEIHDLLRPRLS